MSLKQRKIKFEPRIKLNHNIYIELTMNYYATFTVIDNFQFLSANLILCILVKYIIPYHTLYNSLLLQSASKQLLYIDELIACQIAVPCPFL